MAATIPRPTRPPASIARDLSLKDLHPILSQQRL